MFICLDSFYALNLIAKIPPVFISGSLDGKVGVEQLKHSEYPTETGKILEHMLKNTF
jgi:hypothetical protein